MQGIEEKVKPPPKPIWHSTGQLACSHVKKSMLRKEMYVGRGSGQVLSVWITRNLSHNS